MYKTLDQYANIANSIKPEIGSDFDERYCTNINEPTKDGISDFAQASRKLNFRTRLEDASDAPPDYYSKILANQNFKSINPTDSMYDGFDADEEDGFGEFLSNLGTSDKKIVQELSEDSDDMISAIADFDGSEPHSDWLDKMKNSFNEKQQTRIDAQSPKESFSSNDDFDKDVSKSVIPEDVRSKMIELITSMKNNKKFNSRLNEKAPADYSKRGIEAFVKNMTKTTDINPDIAEQISSTLLSDLKASHGDITQLYELYK